jgi:cation diffusion facilitator CzcD-associated flavoprotein CzcO
MGEGDGDQAADPVVPGPASRNGHSLPSSGPAPLICAEGDIEHFPVVIVGAGFAGLGMSIALADAGFEHVILERAPEVGGTWWANSYPGARCDVPSHLYSFSFAPNPDWTHTYSAQEEILDYLVRCADRFGVRDRIRFSTEVVSARWDEENSRWDLETSAGRLTTDFLVGASGPLSQPSVPEIAGLDTFRGVAFHSGAWNHDHSLAGKRVAVIGTGASAIQIIPSIQPLVDKLYVFQRTPPWVLPHPGRRIGARERLLHRRFPVLQRAKRLSVYTSHELLILALARRPRLLRGLRKLGLAHLERQVPDAEMRRRLTPDYVPGCKRLLISNTYYPAISAENVELVTDRIGEIGPNSISTGSGENLDVDTIILATGFAVTDPPIAHHLVGASGRTLAHNWESSGMGAYRGTTMPDFPNLFFLAGPNTGIGHTSLLVMIEAQISYVTSCLEYAREHSVGRIEVRSAPCERWNAELQKRVAKSVWNTGGCASWYLDRHGRNTTLWPDFTFRFMKGMRRFDCEAYKLRPASTPSWHPGHEPVAGPAEPVAAVPG